MYSIKTAVVVQCIVGVVPATVSIAMHQMCDLKPNPWTVHKKNKLTS